MKTISLCLRFTPREIDFDNISSVGENEIKTLCTTLGIIIY